MEEASWFSRIGERGTRPQELVEQCLKAWPLIWQQIPREQRVNFLKSMAEEHLGALLADMSREERAALMNGLLPLIAREFPLADLDVLTAFSAPPKYDGALQDKPDA